MTDDIVVVEKWAAMKPEDPVVGWWSAYPGQTEPGKAYIFFAFEFIVVLRGRLGRFDRSGNHELRPGDMAFAGPWEPHKRWALEDNTQTVTMVFLPSFLHTTDVSDPTLVIPFLHPGVRRDIQPGSAEERNRIVSRAFLMRDAVERKTLFGRRLARLDMQRLLLEITEGLDFDNAGRNLRKSYYGYLQIFKVFDFIHREMSTRITLERAAQHVNISRSKFSGLFKEVTGQTFAEYLLEVRLQNARQLILSTNDKLAVIASDTGFSDACHMSRHFKQRYGVSPGSLPRGEDLLTRERIGMPSGKTVEIRSAPAESRSRLEKDAENA